MTGQSAQRAPLQVSKVKDIAVSAMVPVGYLCAARSAVVPRHPPKAGQWYHRRGTSSFAPSELVGQPRWQTGLCQSFASDLVSRSSWTDSQPCHSVDVVSASRNFSPRRQARTFAPHRLQRNSWNSFGRKGGDNVTRTHGLCRDSSFRDVAHYRPSRRL